MNTSTALVLTLLGPVISTQGAVFTFDNINQSIPDGSGTGLVSARPVSGLSGVIAELTLTLSVSGVGAGAFNGDLYATLQHADGATTGFAVLLNRPGRRTGDDLGYWDSGLSVTFDDSGSAQDVHNYRAVLFSGDHNHALAGPLQGTWGSDGRTADPALVLGDVDLPSTTLRSFQGLDPNGSWILFLADLEGGGEARLDSWSLSITTGAMVPEPAAWWLVSGFGLAGFAILRRRLFP